jgi:hypothetical protein
MDAGRAFQEGQRRQRLEVGRVPVEIGVVDAGRHGGFSGRFLPLCAMGRGLAIFLHLPINRPML